MTSGWLPRNLVRMRRRLTYRWQATEFWLRRSLPRPLFQLLKPIYNRLGWPAAQKRAQAASPLTSTLASTYTIICFPIITWEYRFQRPQQLLTRFGRAGHRIYYLRTDFVGQTLRLEPLAPNVMGLGLPGPADLDIYADELSPQQIETWLQVFDDLRLNEGLKEVVCFVQLPFWGPLALAARKRWGWRTVYDCMDEHSGFPATGPGMLAQETPLIRESDLVLVTAGALYKKCAPIARQCILIPNAADFDHFHTPRGEDALPDLNGPIIGYYGAISRWFASSYVYAAAVAHPDWQFVLIGSDPDTDLHTLEPLPNVHLIGEQPYSALPAYLHRFDVAIIPFVSNKLTRATNPVKFYEYLSAGKPVVAAGLPELEAYRDLIYLASDAESFVSQLELAVAERNPARNAARVAVAKKNLWADRAALLDEQICQLYDRVSIVIVSQNDLVHLRMCLDSIWDKTAYPNYEVVVTDNGSSTDVVEYLKHSRITHRRLKVIFNADDLGFARATNIGLAAMDRSNFVVLLNYDTVVTPGWLSRLISHANLDATVGMVGAVTGWASDDGRFTTGYQSIDDLDVFAERQADSHAGQAHAMPTLNMFCVALRRDVLDHIGPLDESFGQGFFEDVDYAMRLHHAGYRILRAEDVVIHHWQVARPDNAAANQLFDSNRKRFEQKWGQRWDQLPDGIPLFSTRNK